MTAAPANGIHAQAEAMIVDCPSCGTRYKIDVEFPAAGRVVRCTKCRETWLQAGRGAVPAAPAAGTAALAVSPQAPSLSLRAALAHANDAASHASAVPSQNAVPAQSSTRWRLAVLSAVLIALLLLAGIAAIRYRDAVTAFWPQSARAYSMIGLHLSRRP